MLRQFVMLSVVLSGCAGGASFARPFSVGGRSDGLAEIERAFPRSVEVGAGALPPRIQFCPDNTCEAFISGGASREELSDFAFLFVFYFSEYRVLDAWRAGEVASLLAERVIAQRANTACPAQTGREAARCILRNMASRRDVRIEGTRFDEGVRATFPIALP